MKRYNVYMYSPMPNIKILADVENAKSIPNTTSTQFEIEVNSRADIHTLKVIDMDTNKVYMFKTVEITQDNAVMRNPVEIILSYFTFGCGQVFNGYYVEIACDLDTDPRTIMNNAYGRNWSMEYSINEWHKYTANELAKKWNWTRLHTIVLHKDLTEDRIVIVK